MPRLLTEFIGTFFLVLTFGLTVLSGNPFAPLAIGCSLMVMMYMGGHISGGHFNPAVSLAVFLRGKLERKDLLPYWGAQLLGAIVAAHGVMLIMGTPLVVTPSADHAPIFSLVLEFLFTFALVLVFLNTARQENGFHALAVGFTVVVGALAAGPISGGAFNPAVGLGPTLVDMVFAGGAFGEAWIYLVAPLLGGWAAAAVYQVQNPGG